MSGAVAMFLRRVSAYVFAPHRVPPSILLGSAVVFLSSVYYSFEENSMTFVTPQRAEIFQLQAETYLLTLLLSVLLVAYGIWKYFEKGRRTLEGLESIPLQPIVLVRFILSRRNYVRIFIASSVLYGLFYSLVSSVIVYQPMLNFTEAYGTRVPSAAVVPCCGPPLSSPIVTIYLTEHLGLVLIPLTLIFLATISVLFGLNLALSVFAFQNRARESGNNWLIGLGATVGLFTGCPACAGLFLVSAIGGAGAVTLTTVIAYYQPLFVLVSVPVLLFTTVATARSLTRVFKEGCIVPKRI